MMKPGNFRTFLKHRPFQQTRIGVQL